MRKIFTFLLIVGLFMNYIPNVKAVEIITPTYVNFCEYEFPDNEDLKAAVVAFSNTSKPSDARLRIIYINSKGKDKYDELLSPSESSTTDALLLNFYNKGVCPKYAYVKDKICFDSDGKTCQSVKEFKTDDGVGTLKTNLKDQIKDFANNYEITEDLIYNEDIGKTIDEAFTEQFLDGVPLEEYGEEAAQVILNMEEYQQMPQIIANRVTAKKTEMLNDLREENKEKKQEIEESYESGSITEEEYHTKLAQIESELTEAEAKLEKAFGEQITSLEDVSSTISKLGLIFNGELECSSFLGNGLPGTPLYYLNFAYDIIKYVALILLLVLTLVDYIKAIASSNNDAIKKASQKTIKRIIIAVVILLLPTLINFILKIFGFTGSSTCAIS